MSNQITRLVKGMVALAPIAALGTWVYLEPNTPAPAPSVQRIDPGEAAKRIWCSGPFAAREEVATTTDAQYAPTKPNPEVKVNGVSLDSLSPLLAGANTASETGQTTGATKPAPSLSTVNLAGQSVGLKAESGAFSDATLPNATVNVPTALQWEGKQQELVGDSVATFTNPDGDYRGVSVAHCKVNAIEQTFVGIDTSNGNSARLVVNNATGRNVKVNLSLSGEKGAVDMSGRGSLTIPAQSTQSVLLESIAPNQKGLTLKLVSTGASVSAQVETSRLEGITAKGINVQTRAEEADTEQVVTGVLRGGASNPALITLYNPNMSESKVKITAQTAGSVTANSTAEQGQNLDLGEVTVPAQSSIVKMAEGIGAGDWSFIATGDAPFQMSVASDLPANSPQGPGRGIPSDYFVAGAQPVLRNASVVALPVDHSRDVLLVANRANAAEVQVLSIQPDGSANTAKTFKLAANASAKIAISEVAPSDAIALVVIPSPGADLHAGIAHLPLLKDGAAGISVYAVPVKAIDDTETRITYQRP